MSNDDEKTFESGMLDDSSFQVEEEPTEETGSEESEEESEESTETKETEPIDPLKALGLDGQYKSVEEAREALSSDRAYRTQIEQERANLRRRVEELESRKPVEKQPEYDPEQFVENPKEWLTKMGFVTREEADEMTTRKALEIADHQSAAQFVRSTPDYDKFRPQMRAIYAEFPALDYMPRAEAVRLAYRLAKGNEKPRIEDTTKVDPAKKDKARTVGGETVKKTELQPSDYAKMSLEEMEKVLPVE